MSNAGPMSPDARDALADWCEERFGNRELAGEIEEVILENGEGTAADTVTDPTVFDPAAAPTASFRVLRSVEMRLSDGRVKSLKRRLGEALDHFPALAGQTVTVACRMNPDREEHTRWNPYASADPVNRLIRVPTHERTTNVILYHELAHLAIEIKDERGADVPTSSEEFCSLYAIGRQPPELIDEDRIPYLGHPDPPIERWPTIARRALEYREDHHAYIKQARQWFGTTGEDDE